MSSGTVLIATFTNLPEAEATRNRLASLGIESEVRRDDVGGMHPHLDLSSGVKLVVNAEDEAAARETLADLNAQSKAPAWTCPACGEKVEGNFNTCWNCGREQN